MKKLQWRTEKRRVKDLVDFAGNPQEQSEWSSKTLEKSLKKYNLVETPVIDTNDVLLAGHGRKQALIAMGREEEEIDVRVPSRPLSQKEREGYLLISNSVHGFFNQDLLSGFDQKLLLEVLDPDTLRNLWDENLEVEDDEWNTEEELKKIRQPKVKLGDTYKLGEHIIHCADSTNQKSVRRLMNGKRASVIYTDPPFNIGLSYEKGIGGTRNYGGHVNDSKPDNEYQDFLHKALSNGLLVCEKDAHIFVYHDPRYTWMLQELFRKLNIKYRRTCLWVKNNATPTPNVAFNRQYEPALYGVIGNPYLSPIAQNVAEIMNKNIGSGNRTLDDIYDAIDIWLARRVSSTTQEHPTEKPPSLHERALRRCSRPGDIVLDLFSGSGSLLITCEQLKRVAYLVEREPIFVELTLRRYEQLTGNKAKKLN